jgi:hypothetical protein
VLLLGLVLFGGLAAQAAPPGGYVGFSLGSAEVKDIDEAGLIYTS